MPLCKICKYESKNLESHISKAHIRDAKADGSTEPLEWYVQKFDCTETDVIDADLLEEEIPAASAGTVSMLGISIPIVGQTVHLQKSTPHYHFAAFTKDLVQDYLEKKNVMLVGHTGCGKTSVINELGARIKHGVVRVNMNGQTSIGDFVGMWTVKGGETVWVDGILPLAMRDGYILIIDEIDFAEPAILSVLNSVLEPSGKLCLKEKGHELVEPHENFRIFATANTVGCMSGYRHLYPGTNPLNEAFLDRFSVYHVNYLPPEQEAKVLAASIGVSEKVAGFLVKVANSVRGAFEKEEVQCTFSLRRLISWGQMVLRTKDPIVAAESTIFSKISSEDAAVIKGIINNVIPPKAKS